MKNLFSTNAFSQPLRALLCAALLTASFGTTPAHAAEDDCMESGGKTVCVPPIFKKDPTLVQDSEDFSYQFCEDTLPYLAYGYRLCIVAGGAWSGSMETGGCTGAAPITSGNFEGFIESFIGQFVAHPACGYNQIGDSGWGISLPVGDQCAPGGDVVRNGLVLQTRRAIDYGGNNLTGSGCGPSGWQRRMVAIKSRQLVCPTGFQEKWQANGDLQCAPLPPCERCAGNPINIGNGAKLQAEVDYRSPAPGGHTFTRYYNSFGASHIDPASAKPSDVWRHTWARNLRKVKDVVDPSKPHPFIKAKAIRPDGRHLFFDLFGNEMHNLWGGGHTLKTGPILNGARSGYRLTTPEGDVEEYADDQDDAKILALVTRQGYTYTLTVGAVTPIGKETKVRDHYNREIAFVTNDANQLVSFTDPVGRVTTYQYEEGQLKKAIYPDTTLRLYTYDGNFKTALTSITDERNVAFATWSYDNQGRAVSSEHGDGIDKVTLSYAAPGTNVAHTVTDAFGATHQYAFNRLGGVYKSVGITHTHPTTGAAIEREGFDAQGNRTYRSDGNNVRTNYTFDPVRNLETSRTEGLNFGGGTTAATRTISTAWHADYRLPIQITAPGGGAGTTLTTTFDYDAKGNLLSLAETSGTSRIWTFGVNEVGQPTLIDGPRGDVADQTAIGYYAPGDPCKGCRGQVKQVTNAAGHLTTFDSYDDDGRLTQFTDANQIVTTMTYHVRGWLATQTTHGKTTSYAYDETGNLVKVTLPSADWLAFTYDAGNRLVGVDDLDGNAIDYQLDAQGNRVKTTTYNSDDAVAIKRQAAYDSLNRIARTLGAANQLTTYLTNMEGQVTQVNDAEGRSTVYLYDEINRLSRITQPSGPINFTYTAGDLVASIKDAKNLTTTYGYNGFGELTSLNSPDTGATNYTVDGAGNTQTKTDARSIATTYTYDALNRLTAATVPDGTVNNEYDDPNTPNSKGRLTKITDPSGNTKFTYDPWGAITSVVQTTSGQTLTTSYGYTDGRPTSLTLPSGKVISYQYQGTGRIRAIDVNGAPILGNVKYQPFGPMRAFVFANSEPYVRTYDKDGHIETVTLGPAAGTYEDFSQTFGYDGVDRLISVTVTGAPSQTREYAYDGVNRISGKLNSQLTNYNYQANTNRLTSLTGATTKSYTHDAAGNITNLAGMTLTYDGRGRLKQAGTSTYLVNGLGQRVAKTAGGSTRIFVYDLSGHLIGEYDQAGNPIQETVWLGDTPVAVLKPKAGGGYDVFNVFADYLNTPRVIANQQNQMVWRWDQSDPFGYTQPNQNPSNLGVWEFNGRFPGQYYDAETGCYYNYFRDCYISELGRYSQSDPIGLNGGISTFGYAAGNPVKYADPSGLYITTVQAVCANPAGAALCAEILGDYTESAARIAKKLNPSCNTEDLEKLSGMFKSMGTVAAVAGGALAIRSLVKMFAGAAKSVEQGRDAFGRFLPKSGGEVVPGSQSEQAVWDAIKQKPGWNVIEGRVSARNAAGDLRIYDGAAVSPHGRVIGLEVKSGGATRTSAQSAFDAGVNTFNPAVGVGNNAGLEIGRSLLIRRP
jgi:RHS repeat-associated protein